MVKKRVNDIAFLGITLSLITILAFAVPRIFAVDLAFPLIPIFVAAELKGWKIGAICSTFYGILSLIISFTTSTSILRFVFQNPMVSVFPRIFVGLVTGLIFSALYKKTAHLKNKNGLKISSFAAAVCGVATNTILVLSMLYLFYRGKDFEGLVINIKTIMTIIVSTNTLIEIILFPFLTAPIVYAVKKNQSNIVP